ncbi:MAG: membrane bound O-acyl transferase family-domain-containing protein [Planctomycetaceae bacterium]|nr:membrane bound O-acyl transferase family-domain-containing protein [Planctomycetaceae bacterium]
MSWFGYPPWAEMWGIAATIFLLCKLATLSGAQGSWWSKFWYVVAWPGMHAEAFCGETKIATPTFGELCFAILKATFGLVLLFLMVPWIGSPLLRGWTGMVGVIFTLHFGLFHGLSWFWRKIGYNARPLMDWPILATSIADFWGRRWNTAFRDLTHRFLFRPLAVRMGARLALAVGFLISGLVHEVVISIPAGGGFGLPTAYFVLQGAGLLLERSIPVLKSRWFTILVLLLPAYGLFHPPFVLNVIIPFLNWLHALTLTIGTW